MKPATTTQATRRSGAARPAGTTTLAARPLPARRAGTTTLAARRSGAARPAGPIPVAARALPARLVAAVLLAAAALLPASAAAAPATVLSRGHVDALNVRLDGDALRVTVKDGTVEPAVLRAPGDVLLHAVPASAVTLAADLPPRFGFLGRPGDTVYVLPEVQRSELLWPGWDTAGVPRGVLAPDELRWRLVGVDGPGAFKLYTTDVFGAPRVLFDSADGLPDATTMATGTHVHANWVFTRPGRHRVTFELAGTRTGGEPVASEPVEYQFQVGELAADAAPTPTPQASPSPQPTPSAPKPTPTAERPNLRLTSAKLRDRTLTLGTRLSTRSRVEIAVRTGSRVVARAKPRTVPASRRTLRVRLNRTLARGTYRVRVTARAGDQQTTRTIPLRLKKT